MYKIIFVLSLFLGMQATIQAQIVNIPDANFKAALLAHGSTITGPSVNIIDTDGDGEIQISEAQAYTGNILINSKSITDLTGIEAFTAITILHCKYNQLSSINISMNTALVDLNCSFNQLNALDVSSQTALVNLSCSDNELNNLDVSNNLNLGYLSCAENNLSNLDVQFNSDLVYLYFNGNELTTIDITNNANIIFLDCQDNQLNSLDLANQQSLSTLNCYNNKLSHLDLSVISNLQMLDCSQNLPFLQICVSDLLLVTNAWIKDALAFFVEDCQYSLAVKGEVAIDTNSNCQVDSFEYRLGNTFLSFDDGVNQTFVLTNGVGAYQAHLDTGTYTLNLLTSSANVYSGLCVTTQQVVVDTNYQIQTIDFSLDALIVCPKLEVNISTPFLRRCFNSVYHINYCNTGGATEDSVYIEVELDTSLYFNSSTVPVFSQNGNVYRFNVGSLPPNTCGRITINVTVSCYSELGQIHCVDTRIYPNDLCLTSITKIDLTHRCLTDTVLFVVTNSGNSITLPYLLLEDTIVVDTGSLALNMGQSASLYYPTNISGTATYQLVLANGSPTHYTASKLVGCDANSAAMDLLHLPNLPQDFADIDCTPNRGSYDPNDKTGYPLGYSSNHYIQPNSTIDYRIRFQNTGTDTAIFINIFDTISPYLNLGTLNMGAASHPYTLHIMPSTPSGEQVLRFQFSPIYLPDSNVNEPASNGFIEYSIAQVANLSNGTIINNSASIYFDYNAPIQTNTTLHTVCDNCHPENITNAGTVVLDLDQIAASSYKVVAIPNPFSIETRIEIQGYKGQAEDLKLEVYDVMGRLQNTLNGNREGRFLLQRGALPTGVYFFRITEKGDLLQSGRLVVGE